jgi:SPP1 gp7 family putative phage head morphogenesis protein
MEAKKTPIDSGIVARVSAGLRYVATGKPNEWFGPMLPLPEMVPENQRESALGRQFDYNVGVNTQSRPRSGEAISFDDMRQLADAFDILRLVIETRKDQMAKLKWAIMPTAKGAKPDARCDELAAFFLSPDKEHSWDTWLRMVLEDLFVIDAPAIYPRLTKGGGLYALEPIDGSTIKRVLDVTGRVPQAPDAAYQQILKGVPAINYTRDELIYMPRNVRTNKVYGMSPVEQIITTVNIALRRQANQLSYYTEGNVPNLLFQVPADWQPNQIQEFQAWWDLVTQGNTKHYGRFIPAGVNPVETKTAPMKDMFDEWLARVVCFAFSIEATPFVAQVNRSVAETSREQSLAEGLEPNKIWIQNLINRVIVQFFGYTDIGFVWVDDETITPANAEIYIRSKVLTPDEVRAELGKDPLTPEEREASWPTPIMGMAGGFGNPVEDKKDAAYLPALLKKKSIKPINRDRPAMVKLEKKLAEVIKAFLKEQAPKAAAQIGTLLGLEKMNKPLDQRMIDALEAFDFTEWSSVVAGVSAVLADVADSGAQEALMQLGITDAELSTSVRVLAANYANDRAAEMVGMKWVDGNLIPNPDAKWQITEGTRDMLRGVTTQAIDQGWTVSELADQMQSSEAFSDSRALMIARTETAKADTEGAMRTYRESGVVQEKEWLTAHDDLVSEECAACEEAGVIGLDETFPSGEAAPPNHPNCRCVILPVVKLLESEQENGQ